jgi:hypothetical protein
MAIIKISKTKIIVKRLIRLFYIFGLSVIFTFSVYLHPSFANPGDSGILNDDMDTIDMNGVDQARSVSVKNGEVILSDNPAPHTDVVTQTVKPTQVAEKEKPSPPLKEEYIIKPVYQSPEDLVASATAHNEQYHLAPVITSEPPVVMVAAAQPKIIPAEKIENFVPVYLNPEDMVASATTHKEQYHLTPVITSAPPVVMVTAAPPKIIPAEKIENFVPVYLNPEDMVASATTHKEQYHLTPVITSEPPVVMVAAAQPKIIPAEKIENFVPVYLNPEDMVTSATTHKEQYHLTAVIANEPQVTPTLANPVPVEIVESFKPAYQESEELVASATAHHEQYHLIPVIVAPEIVVITKPKPVTAPPVQIAEVKPAPVVEKPAPVVVTPPVKLAELKSSETISVIPEKKSVVLPPAKAPKSIVIIATAASPPAPLPKHSTAPIDISFFFPVDLPDGFFAIDILKRSPTTEPKKNLNVAELWKSGQPDYLLGEMTKIVAPEQTQLVSVPATIIPAETLIPASASPVKAVIVHDMGASQTAARTNNSESITTTSEVIDYSSFDQTNEGGISIEGASPSANSQKASHP